MNKLSVAKRSTILQMLCEGSSMRAITRVTGVSLNTVTKLLIDAANTERKRGPWRSPGFSQRRGRPVLNRRKDDA